MRTLHDPTFLSANFGHLPSNEKPAQRRVEPANEGICRQALYESRSATLVALLAINKRDAEAEKGLRSGQGTEHAGRVLPAEAKMERFLPK